MLDSQWDSSALQTFLKQPWRMPCAASKMLTYILMTSVPFPMINTATSNYLMKFYADCEKMGSQLILSNVNGPSKKLTG
eukprot:8223106-Ditylum_brightwellii.AAC.1